MTRAAQPLGSFLFAPGTPPATGREGAVVDADAVILDLEDAVAIAESRPPERRWWEPSREAGAACCTSESTPSIPSSATAIWWRSCGPGSTASSAEDRRRAAGLADGRLARRAGTRARPAHRAHRPDPDHRDRAGLERLDAILACRQPGQRSPSAPATSRSTSAWCGSRDEAELMPARARCVIASRAAGIEAPLDTVWADLATRRGSTPRPARGWAGVPGKMCIHPDQLRGVNAVSPERDEVTLAQERGGRRFAKAEARGQRAIQLDGSSSTTRSYTGRSGCWTGSPRSAPATAADDRAGHRLPPRRRGRSGSDCRAARRRPARRERETSMPLASTRLPRGLRRDRTRTRTSCSPSPSAMELSSACCS